MKKLYLLYIIILLSLTLCVASCSGDSQRETLDRAESIMEDHPDSALNILEGIDKSKLGSKKERARYALLMSMALDKNYIDTTTFDVLQPAIDYYLRKGNPDEKLRTYYYQGRIYQNQGDLDNAMHSFMNGLDLKQLATDSLLLARTLVAQGTLYLKQYKIKEFVNNNLESAKLYGSIGKNLSEIKSYTNAIDGYIILNDKEAADRILVICNSLAKKTPDSSTYLFPSLLSYTVEFCPPEEVMDFLDKHKDWDLTTDELMNYARGYTKTGDYDRALNILSEISPSESTWDSLKYASVKIDILEKTGRFEEALNLYKDYSVILERNQKELLSQDLLFADKKHQLEINNLLEIQGRNKIIWITVCSIFGLAILVGWLYYRGYRSKTKRILAEKENQNLRLEQDNLRKEKENAELERDKKALEAENLKLEIVQLEDERDNLKELQQKKSELAKPVQNVIKKRLDMLNGLLAKEITNDKSYAASYNKLIETIHNDKRKFMESTRAAIAVSHPRFMEHLARCGLTANEINYLCLFSIGLSGKEVGEYLQIKRHYVISHEIRKKLGIDEHETNLGPYIRRLMKDSEK